MAKKSPNQGLEKSLQGLEAVVEKMESGDLTLEESLKAFEEGVRLTRDCQQALQQAEQKVRILLEPDAEPQDFNADDNNDR